MEPDPLAIPEFSFTEAANGIDINLDFAEDLVQPDLPALTDFRMILDDVPHTPDSIAWEDTYAVKVRKDNVVPAYSIILEYTKGAIPFASLATGGQCPSFTSPNLQE